jgi:predicted transposase/invertase (TIGR01784 family)
MNMLFTEWNWDDALAIQREEGKEEGLEKGLKKGLEKGKEEAVKNLLEFGMKPEQISQALKLSVDTVSQYLAR